MSEGAAASFFAKKKKKKAFTLNANWVDADTVTSTTHVDAPALSTDVPPSSAAVESLLEPAIVASTNEGDSEWDETAVLGGGAAHLLKATTTTLELGTLSSTATSSQHAEGDSIAEKLAVEETRAALAAARLGMERQAAASQQATEPAKPVETGGRYIPAHLRSAAANSRSTALNVASNELFPDLQQAEQMAATKSKPKISKVAWGPKPTTKSVEPVVVEPPPKVAEVAVENVPAPTEAKSEALEPAPAVVEDAVVSSVRTTSSVSSSGLPTLPKTATKKKKKDLSTFKVAASSS